VHEGATLDAEIEPAGEVWGDIDRRDT